MTFVLYLIGLLGLVLGVFTGLTMNVASGISIAVSAFLIIAFARLIEVTVDIAHNTHATAALLRKLLRDRGADDSF